MNFNITHRDLGNVIHMQISLRDDSEGYDQHSIFIRVRIESGYDALTAKRPCPLSPEELKLPLAMNTIGAPACNKFAGSDPETLFEAGFPWLIYELVYRMEIIKELVD